MTLREFKENISPTIDELHRKILGWARDQPVVICGGQAHNFYMEDENDVRYTADVDFLVETNPINYAQNLKSLLAKEYPDNDFFVESLSDDMARVAVIRGGTLPLFIADFILSSITGSGSPRCVSLDVLIQMKEEAEKNRRGTPRGYQDMADLMRLRKVAEARKARGGENGITTFD